MDRIHSFQLARGAAAALVLTLVGACYGSSADSAGAGSTAGAAGAGSSGTAGTSAGTSTTAGTGGAGGEAAGTTGGAAGATAGSGGRGTATGGAGGTGSAGAAAGGAGGTGSAGAAAGVVGSMAGTGAGSTADRECMSEAECKLVDRRCCPCDPPTLDQVDAVSRNAGMNAGPCPPCGACVPSGLPHTVVAECVEGTCQAVLLSEQPYTRCEHDSDCSLMPTDCCGWCGEASVLTSYAINTTATDFLPCDATTKCPPVDCDVQFTAEAYCTTEGHCSARPL